MSYLDLINAFEKWLETNYLPSLAQLLWYRLIALFNRAGWSEWIVVDNRRLMSIMQIESEKTFIRYRDKLVENKFFEYKKGKKGSPNQYKILTVNFTAKMTVETTVKTGVKMTTNVSNINRLDIDKKIYFNLIKINKTRARGKTTFEKIAIVKEMKKDEGFLELPENLQEQAVAEILTEI